MTSEYYERKINDVITKCPIEAGVEILAYNLLDAVIDPKECSLIDVNRLWKHQETRLDTEAGIPDLAIVSPDFTFKAKDRGCVYGLVETKAASVSLSETLQIQGEMRKADHFLYTNGIVWKYYDRQKQVWSTNVSKEVVSCTTHPITVDVRQFENLMQKLSEIDWRR